jgi:dTDP-4-dehydrorhamnose reductase
MKLLVLGASGMLGHKAWEVFGREFETYGTLRSAPFSSWFAESERVISGVRAEDPQSLSNALSRFRPDVVVNCIGVVKQLAAARSAIPSITINALFPHQVAELAASADARMIQISTDCVFSGRRGFYNEDDLPDPIDLYGRTKLLGETAYDHTLTIRTSIIGRELVGAHGLLEWFLSQTGTVRGYTDAVFSGVTTETLADMLVRVIAEHPTLAGVWHVAGERITKYDLLQQVARAYKHDVTIEADDSVQIDRSLDDTRFRAATGIPRPNWSEMLAQLTRDPTPYREMRAVTC